MPPRAGGSFLGRLSGECGLFAAEQLGGGAPHQLPNRQRAGQDDLPVPPVYAYGRKGKRYPRFDCKDIPSSGQISPQRP